MNPVTTSAGAALVAFGAPGGACETRVAREAFISKAIHRPPSSPRGIASDANDSGPATSA